MNLNDYQQETLKTALYKDKEQQLILVTLGLNGEAGEVAEKVKKLIRDKDSVLSDEERQNICYELGDVLWYVSVLAHTLGISLEDVAQSNLKKTQSRMSRGVLKGEGDHR